MATKLKFFLQKKLNESILQKIDADFLIEKLKLRKEFSIKKDH